MMKNKILITKDVLRSDYLNTYNSKSFFKTKNINKLANKGTQFNSYYCSAPTTSMAMIGMFLGESIHNLDKGSIHDKTSFQTTNLFSELENRGVDTHVLWSEEFKVLASDRIHLFDKKTVEHFAPLGGAVEISPQNPAFKKIIKKHNNSSNFDLTKYFYDYIKDISEKKEKWFVWCHCPHVFYPAKSYGEDIEIFDNFIGEIMENIDAEIILSADHGHAKCEKGRVVYGYDVYEPAIKIPLITPNYFNESNINFPVSQIQLKNIVLNESLAKDKFVYVDTRYYKQPDRKLAIIHNNYKLIYDKLNKTEELYDLSYDPNEDINLLIENFPDFERKSVYPLNEIIYYPFWNAAKENYFILKEEKNRIWRTETYFFEKYDQIKTYFKNVKKKGVRWMFRKNRTVIVWKGRWGSTTKIPMH